MTALELGLGIKERGFNIFVVGGAGTGRTSMTRQLLNSRAKEEATPDDVVDIVLPALRHRVIMSAESEVEGLSVDDELQQMLKGIEVPRGV